MSYHHYVIRLSWLAVSLVVFLITASATNAKSARGSNTQPSNADTILNLDDFGAVGDGIANDGPAFQRALDALANAGGGTLLVPAGTYLVATPVVKDFSNVPNATITIQGVPSTTMPAPPTATGNDLGAGLNLTSDIIPATGSTVNAFTLTNLRQLLVEHLSFTGRENIISDAFITLSFIKIDKATIRHCEFYGISTFGLVPNHGGGNVIRAAGSDLSIELSVFLGSTANSGAYAPLVENIEWKKFSISNSIFLDYGIRSFFSKTGLGAPLSWINVGGPAPTTPDSARREIIIRDTFLDEGGWVGITAYPHLFGPQLAPIDLIYISGIKLNVSNLGTSGHHFYDVENVLIEKSHYGWSHNTIHAISLNRVGNAILDNLTCIDDADRLHADDRTERFTVINSQYRELDSSAGTTTALKTTPEQDPVQYVRQAFLSALGRQPDPAAHFYWSDLLIRCEEVNDCLNQKRSELSAYLAKNPKIDFSITGIVEDEFGDPLSGVTVSLSGGQSTVAISDAQGRFHFSGLPTSGSYTLAANKERYNFPAGNQTVLRPANDVVVDLHARLNRYTISGRLTTSDGNAIDGVTMQLAQNPGITTTTDESGRYSIPELLIGGNYTIVPVSDTFTFTPANIAFNNLVADREANFQGLPRGHSISGRLTRSDGSGIAGVTLQVAQQPTITVTTDANGRYSIPGLVRHGNYTIVPAPTDFAFTPVNITFNDLVADREANFVGQVRPDLITVVGSDMALVLNAVNFLAEPFSILDSLGFSSDGVTRVILFARDLDGATNPSQISVTAEDQAGITIPLEVENVANLGVENGLKQLNVKLSPNFRKGECVQLRITIAGVTSNSGRICFSN